jgi:hypothetical protein
LRCHKSSARPWRRDRKRAFKAVKARKSLGRCLIGRMRYGLYDLVDRRARDRFERKRQPV